MNIRPMNRALTVALLSVASVVALDGCTAAKKMSAAQPAGPQPTSATDTPKKEYNWQDMSTGKANFRPINQTPQ